MSLVQTWFGAAAVKRFECGYLQPAASPEEYARAKKDAKVVADKLGISEQEAEGRLVAEIMRNSDQQTADASGAKPDWKVRGIVGCQNRNCNGYKNDPQYANHDYNSQYIMPNQAAYDLGQQQIGTGLTDAGLREQNIVYERTGKAALAVTACLVSGGVACKAASVAISGGMSLLFSARVNLLRSQWAFKLP
jgi:filamentous hemagglutinin